MRICMDLKEEFLRLVEEYEELKNQEAHWQYEKSKGLLSQQVLEKDLEEMLRQNRFLKEKVKKTQVLLKRNIVDEIEDFMFGEYDKLIAEQKDIRSWDSDYLHNTAYIANYGEISFMGKLYDFMKKQKRPF